MKYTSRNLVLVLDLLSFGSKNMGGYENRDLGVGLVVDGHHTTIKTMIGRGMKKERWQPRLLTYIFWHWEKNQHMFRTRMAWSIGVPSSFCFFFPEICSQVSWMKGATDLPKSPNDKSHSVDLITKFPMLSFHFLINTSSTIPLRNLVFTRHFLVDPYQIR